MFVMMGFSSSGDYKILDTQDWVIEEIPSSKLLQAVIDDAIMVKGIERVSTKVKRHEEVDIKFVPWMVELRCPNLTGRVDYYYYDGYMIYSGTDIYSLDYVRRKDYSVAENLVTPQASLLDVLLRLREGLRFANQDYYISYSFNPATKMNGYRIDDIREDNVAFKPVFYIHEGVQDLVCDFFDILSMYVMEDKTTSGLEVKSWDSFTYNGKEYTFEEQILKFGYNRFDTKRLIVNTEYQVLKHRDDKLFSANVNANNIDDFFESENVDFETFMCVRNVFDNVVTGENTSYRPFCDRFRGRLYFEEDTNEIYCSDTLQREKVGNCANLLSPFFSAFPNGDVDKIKKVVYGMQDRVRLMCTDDAERTAKLSTLNLRNNKVSTSTFYKDAWLKNIGGYIGKLDRTVWYETVRKDYVVDRFLSAPSIPLTGVSSKKFMALVPFNLNILAEAHDTERDDMEKGLNDAYRMIDHFDAIGNRRLIPLCLAMISTAKTDGEIDVYIRCLLSLKGVKRKNVTYLGMRVDRNYLLVDYPLILSPLVVEDYKDYYKLSLAFEDVYFSKDFFCNRLSGSISGTNILTNKNTLSVNYAKYDSYFQELLSNAMKLLDATLVTQQDEYY